MTTTRRAIVIGAGGAALGLMACGDDSAGPGGGGAPSTTATGTSTSTGVDDLADVVYEGEASDEALRELYASETLDDASQAARFLTPAAGSALDPAAPSPPEFSWGVGASTMLRHDRPRLDRARRVESRRGSWLERAAGFVFDVRVAHAHGAPTNGRAYLLVFTTSSTPRLLRVFTTALTYTADAFAWDTLLAASGPITVTITNAIFEQNRITSGGGPFVGSPLTLSG